MTNVLCYFFSYQLLLLSQPYRKNLCLRLLFWSVFRRNAKKHVFGLWEKTDRGIGRKLHTGLPSHDFMTCSFFLMVVMDRRPEGHFTVSVVSQVYQALGCHKKWTETLGILPHLPHGLMRSFQSVLSWVVTLRGQSWNKTLNDYQQRQH